MFKQLNSLTKATLFSLIALTLAVLLAVFGQGMGNWVTAVTMFTPLTAVLLMLLVVTHDGYIRTGWQGLGLHRLGLRRWGLAVLGPLLVLSCTYGIVWRTGIGHFEPTALNGVIMLDGPANMLRTLFNLLLGLLMSTLLAAGEEIGWRGYLLPHLLPLGRARALLVHGLLQGIWHLPIMLLTPFYHASGDRLIVATLFLLSTMLGGVFFGYLRLTSASVWPAALGHGAFNMFWTTFMTATVAVSSPVLLEYWAGESGVLTLIGIGLMAGWLLYRLQRQPDARPLHKFIRHTSAILIALLALMFALGRTTVDAWAAPLPQKASEPDFGAIDAYLEAQMAELRIPGLALGIVQGDQVVHLKGFGIADPTGRVVTPQTPFILNSISKSFAALAIMQLVEQGKIELDAPVQRYLPWFQVADAKASAQITVRQLLNQTSGLPESASYTELARPAATADTLEERVRRLSTTQLNRPVGTTFEYTDANYDVLGMVVQSVAGQPYPEYVKQHILTPLAMQRSETTRPEALPTDLATGYRSWFGFPVPFTQWYAHALLPSGDLISSVEDMTHYLIAQLNGGRYNDTALLSPQSITALHQPAVREDDSEKFYGMGWEVRPMNDLSVVRHDGTSANYYADLVLDPAGRRGVIILLNLNSLNLYGGRLHALTGGIMHLLHGQTPPALPAMHHPILYPAMLAILIITVLLVVWLARMAFAWRRWQRQPAQRPRGWRRVGAVGLPLVLPLVWGLLLLVGIPQALYPLAVLQINVPDLGYTALVSGVLAVLWCIGWAGLNWFGARERAGAGTMTTTSADATAVGQSLAAK